MTSLDRVLAELSTEIDALPKRAAVALFGACAGGLRPGFEVWANAHNQESRGLLEWALAAAFSFVQDGRSADMKNLLLGFEESTPDETIAQDCWICADTAIRLAIQPEFHAGPVIEYALEPVLQAATQSLFGVSQVGSGPREEEQVAAVLSVHRVVDAIAFCRWAIHLLKESSSHNEETIKALLSRAPVLLP
jgi:hypothetical protein